MALTVTEQFKSKIKGRRVTLHDITFDTSYPTGGEALTPNTLGLARVESVHPSVASGYLFEYDSANEKLKAFTAGAGLSAGALKVATIDGGAAGDHTVSGIATGDSIISVIQHQGLVPGDAIESTIVAGTTAGDVTVTGIATTDTLISVIKVDFTDASETGTDLTSEFSITGTNTINNACGTDSSGGFLIVTYTDASDAALSVVDLTSEFSVTGADTINNACGTATTNDRLVVTYEDASVGASAVGAEVANGTNLSSVTCSLLAYGV